MKMKWNGFLVLATVTQKSMPQYPIPDKILLLQPTKYLQMNIPKQTFHLERGDLKFDGNKLRLQIMPKSNRIRHVAQIDKMGELKELIEIQLNFFILEARVCN